VTSWPIIDAAYLFGSVARGQARADSDVDVGVLLRADPPRALPDFDRLADLQVRLEDLLGREVDLVPLSAAAPDLLHRMLCDRVLLFDGDHERRIGFEVRARNEYFDLQPLLERYGRDG